MMCKINKICRTCLCMGNTHIGLDAVIPYSDLISIKDKLSTCLPELDLNIVSDAVMCELCVAALHTTFSFKTKCQKTEEYLQNCIRDRKINTGSVQLSQITVSVKQSNDLKNESEHINLQEAEVPSKQMHKKIEIKVDDTYIKQEPEGQNNCKNEEAYQVVDENNDETYNNEDIYKKYKCLECNRTYRREIGLIAHMHMHETERKLSQKAVVLEASSYNMDKIREFLPKQTDNADSVCEICQKSFYSKSNLTVHMRIHTGEKPYCCKICSKAFTQKVYLTAHERTHTGEKPFNCTLCSKSFAQKSYLRTHMIVHTGIRHHICKICGKGCAHTGDLNNHMRIHTGEKPYKCENCGKCFTQSVHLKSHMKIHSGEKPYKCEICHSRYIENRYLKKHMRIHTGERPYCCDKCGKTFHERYVLTEHMKKHTQDTCICTICNTTFYRSSYLTEHMRIHTGEKSFSCKYCNKQFAHKKSLNGHLQVHSKNDVEKTQTGIKSESVETTNELTNPNNETSWISHSNSSIPNRSLLKRNNISLNNVLNHTYEEDTIVKTEYHTDEIEACSFIKIEQNEVDCVGTEC